MSVSTEFRRSGNGHRQDMKLTVLMNCGPWLSVPPPGYGGIENVIAALVPELRRRGVRVVLVSVGDSTLEADEHVSVFHTGQFAQLQRPYNQVMGIAAAHLTGWCPSCGGRDDIVLVHDHQEAFGPDRSRCARARTCHRCCTPCTGICASIRSSTATSSADGRMRVNGVSFAQLTTAPAALRAISVGHVHLATPLAVQADRRPAHAKAGHLVVLGRITPTRARTWPPGSRTASGGISSWQDRSGPATHSADLATADDANPDVRYWRESVEPLVDGSRVRWVGTVHGAVRDTLVATADAALFPIDWEEPGGTAVTESLALGTPVVAFSRGCLPELVESGRTGLLVAPGDEDAFARALTETKAIDPQECRREAARRFTPARMAEKYLRLYARVLDRDSRITPLRPALDI